MERKLTGAPRLLALCSITALAIVPLAAHATDLALDPAHTSATFSVKHLTLTTVSGKIGIKSASLQVNPDDTIASAKADLDLATVDTQFGRRDDDLRSDHWFDVAKYPTMSFVSTKITGTKDDMTVTGDLSFHGVTKPATLIAKYEGSVKDERGRTHVGYTATGTVDRTQWNLGPGFPPAVVGNDVTITIEFEAIEP